MASITKSGSTWRAFVCRKNERGETVRKSGTFDTKKEAAEWASITEQQIKNETQVSTSTRTVSDLFMRYRDEVTTNKKGSKWETCRINLMLQDPIALVRLSKLDTPDFVAWRNRRLAQVSDASVRREWNIWSNGFNVAIREWKWLEKNPCQGVRKPAPTPARDRVFSCVEIEQITTALGWEDELPPSNISSRVGHALMFSLETGLRASELCGLIKEDVFEKYVIVRSGKTTAAARRVPLSPYARTLLALIPDWDTVFGVTTTQIDALFRKARDRCGIRDLHWHDLRHTAVTRLALKLDILSLARMIGHTDPKQLQVYFNRSADDIADDL